MSITDLPDNILKCMDPKDRPKGNAGLTQAEATAKEEDRLEKTEQRFFATWLMAQETQGKLVYNWSSMHKKTTSRPGIPDFQIWAKNKALLIEMKGPIGRLSEVQKEMRELFMASGTDVLIFRDAGKAIMHTKKWLDL